MCEPFQEGHDCQMLPEYVFRARSSGELFLPIHQTKVRGYAYDKIKYFKIRTYFFKKYAYDTHMIRVLNVPTVQ